MKTIKESVLNAIENGARFRIDFKERTLKVGGKLIIDHGKYDGVLDDVSYDSFDDMVPDLEGKYQVYRHSVPSERTESKRNTYFEALPADNLTNEELTFGVQREAAQFDLEFAVLAGIINGTITRDSFTGWFWVSESEPDFVILKNWI